MPNKIGDLQTEINRLRKMNTDKDATIRSLKSKATSSVEDMQKVHVRKLQEQNEDYTRKLQEEIIQLKASVNSLEQRLYPTGTTISMHHCDFQ